MAPEKAPESSIRIGVRGYGKVAIDQTGNGRPARFSAADWVRRFLGRPITSRLEEEARAKRNPHLARALEIEKMEGQRIATRARTAALVTIGLLLIYVNPRMEVLYYQFLLMLFILIGILQQRAARVGQSRLELALIFADLVLLTFTLLMPNPFAVGEWPTALQFRFDGFLYFYVLLAGATLAYSWRTVQSIGLWSATIWMAGVALVYFFGTTFPDMSERVAAALTGYERVFETIDPNSIELAGRIQEIVVFIIVAGILGIKSYRANELLVRQADLAAERANLSRYFAPTLVDELAQRNEPMGGVRSQNVAVLFADIVGFTRYAESHKPEEVISLLRNFHAVLEEAVFAHGGTLDKYLGDGLMASFGTPTTSASDGANAFAAAFAMHEGVDRLNHSRAVSGLEPVQLSVGIHYGPVILGDIGTERRMEFATLGDTVNVAARLEAATRKLSCRIIASDAAMNAIEEQSLRNRYRKAMRLRSGLKLRGRGETVRVWMG
jgi:adenylate cyclase